MRLASFHEGSRVRPGVVIDDEIVDLAVADPMLDAPWVELLERGDECFEQVRRIADSGGNRIPLDSVRLAAPVRPRKFCSPDSCSSRSISFGCKSKSPPACSPTKRT